MGDEATLSSELGAAFLLAPTEMSEGEMLTRAREAYIGTHRPWRWLTRRIRAGKADGRLSAILTALRDVRRPMALIVAERDEATCALILRTTPGLMGLPDQSRHEVAAALMTAVRMGRRG
jgi:hypothetical protein